MESPVRQIKGGRGPCTVIGKCFFSVSHTMMFSYPVFLFWTSEVQTRSKPIIGLDIKIFCRKMSRGWIWPHSFSLHKTKHRNKEVKMSALFASCTILNQGFGNSSGLHSWLFLEASWKRRNCKKQKQKINAKYIFPPLLFSNQHQK